MDNKNANRINAGLTLAMLIEQAPTEEEAMRLAWEFGREHPWVWSKVFNTFQIDEYGLPSFQEPEEDFDFPFELDGKEGTFVFTKHSIDCPPFTERAVVYHQKKGSLKKRRNRWNHKCRNKRGHWVSVWEEENGFTSWPEGIGNPADNLKFVKKDFYREYIDPAGGPPSKNFSRNQTFELNTKYDFANIPSEEIAGVTIIHQGTGHMQSVHYDARA